MSPEIGTQLALTESTTLAIQKSLQKAIPYRRKMPES
jgi:hypothetical protein